MEADYNTLRMSELRALTKDLGLWGYSRLKKADLISLLRFHDASTRTSMEEGAPFDPEKLNNEDDSPFDALYQMIMEERAQFDSEELDNEVDPFSDELYTKIIEEGAQFDPGESDNEE